MRMHVHRACCSRQRTHARTHARTQAGHARAVVGPNKPCGSAVLTAQRMLHVICILALPRLAVPCLAEWSSRAGQLDRPVPVGPAGRPSARVAVPRADRERCTQSKAPLRYTKQTNKHQALRCCLASPRLAARPTGGRRAGRAPVSVSDWEAAGLRVLTTSSLSGFLEVSA
jgi:hypothetical protein